MATETENREQVKRVCEIFGLDMDKVTSVEVQVRRDAPPVVRWTSEREATPDETAKVYDEFYYGRGHL